jgi:hypothetical protein
VSVEPFREPVHVGTGGTDGTDHGGMVRGVCASSVARFASFALHCHQDAERGRGCADQGHH